MTPTGAPDYFKRILLHGVDEDGNTVACLVDKEGRIIFRSVADVETATQGATVSVNAGDNPASSTAVPAGERHILSSICCFNSNTMNDYVKIQVYDGTQFRILRLQSSPAELQSTDWQGSLVMQPGWFIGIVFGGCAQDDSLTWSIIYSVVED